MVLSQGTDSALAQRLVAAAAVGLDAAEASFAAVTGIWFKIAPNDYTTILYDHTPSRYYYATSSSAVCPQLVESGAIPL